MSEGKPLVSEGKPLVSEGKPLVSEGKPLVSEGKPLVSEGKPPVSEGKPLVSEGKPLVSEGIPLVSDGKPLMSEGKPLVSEGKPLVPEGIPLVPEGKPLVPEGIPLVPEGKPLVPEGIPLVSEGKAGRPPDKGRRVSGNGTLVAWGAAPSAAGAAGRGGAIPHPPEGRFASLKETFTPPGSRSATAGPAGGISPRFPRTSIRHVRCSAPTMRKLVVLLAAVVVLLAARASRAGEIGIRGLDGTPWARLVQQIQDDVGSRGGVFPVVVVDGDTPVHCGEYELQLDAVTAAAFRVEACDPATDATALRLVHREALFEPGEIVPRARTASIDAAITRRGRVEGGGAPPQAGSKLWCTVALQPYLWDGLRGEPTPLMPDRFVLRPLDAHIHAAPDGAGWIARGESRFGLRFRYAVDDIRTGKQVLENEATLACADSPAGQAPTAEELDRRRRAGGRPDPVYLPEGAAEASARQAPPWWIALDLPPVTPAATLVATTLIRPLSNTVLPGGVLGSTLYGSRPAVFGGSTLGFSLLHGMLFVPARITVAADANAFVLSGFAGLGLGWNVLHQTSLYAAPVLRYTAMDFAAGWFNQMDGALLVGVRRRFWGSRTCASPPKGGFEAFLEMAAPIASQGPWFLSAGVSNSWGPGGGYPWFASLARCKT